MSASGALIAIDEALILGKRYGISIKLQGDTSNVIIEDLVVTVIRQEPCCIAVKFADPMEWLTIFYVYKQKIKVFNESTDIPTQE